MSLGDLPGKLNDSQFSILFLISFIFNSCVVFKSIIFDNMAISFSVQNLFPYIGWVHVVGDGGGCVVDGGSSGGGAVGGSGGGDGGAIGGGTTVDSGCGGGNCKK